MADGLSVVIGLNAVVVAVTAERPRILTVPRLGHGVGDLDLGSSAADDSPVVEPPRSDETFDALPFGPLDPERDRTLELALRGWVREQAGIEVGYVEQLYTFGDKHRDPRERLGGPRVISIGYLSLALEGAKSEGARWRDWYDFLPWEDWREGRPTVLEHSLEPALNDWVQQGGGAEAASRRERVDIAFGLGGAPWDGYRVLDRYELLYEAGLVAESLRDRGERDLRGIETHGRPMRLDHRRIVATGLQRLRGKIKFRPVVFELLPPTFTLLQLQRVVEALAGRRLHKQNFRRLVEKGGLVEGTGRTSARTGGRPAELFSFRREVLRERPTPGVGLPALRDR